MRYLIRKSYQQEILNKKAQQGEIDLDESVNKESIEMYKKATDGKDVKTVESPANMKEEIGILNSFIAEHNKLIKEGTTARKALLQAYKSTGMTPAILKIYTDAIRQK